MATAGRGDHLNLLGAAVGIVVAALMASAGRRNSITCNGWFSENKLARVNDRITPCDLR